MRCLLPLAAAATALVSAARSSPDSAFGAKKTLTKVHIVAHSHNDPGWLETESQYFQQRSKKIITNVVQSAPPIGLQACFGGNPSSFIDRYSRTDGQVLKQTRTAFSSGLKWYISGSGGASRRLPSRPVCGRLSNAGSWCS